jgi:hypothetical protein
LGAGRQKMGSRSPSFSLPWIEMPRTIM